MSAYRKSICIARPKLALATAAALVFYGYQVDAEKLEPTEYSRPDSGFIEYDTDYCKVSIELSATLKRFSRDKFNAMLKEKHTEALKLCRSAAARIDLAAPYKYKIFWKTVAVADPAKLIALSGSEFVSNDESSGTTVKRLIYDYDIAHELELEDLFVSRDKMLELIVPAARAALAQYKQDTARVALSETELERLLPDGLEWPGMQWNLTAAPKGYRFGAVSLWFPNGAFVSVGDRDLRGGASSTGSVELVVPKSSFIDGIKTKYRAGFMANDE